MSESNFSSQDQLAFKHLKSLESVRNRCSLLFSNPQNWLHFDYDESKLKDCVDNVCDLIARDYKTKAIPMHSRWRHFEVTDELDNLIGDWKSRLDTREVVMNLLDLFVVSVLLDAGAGDKYKFNGVGRSEGLALASLEMFKNGLFSSNPSNPFQCDSVGLQKLTLEELEKAFHVSDSNPLIGVVGRLELLQRLGKTVGSEPKYFESGDCVRVGSLLDFLINNESTTKQDEVLLVDINCLWEVVVYGLNGVWPSTRTKFNGVGVGDVWNCKALANITQNLQPKPDYLYPGTESLVCFHKLSQWLTYSLMEPLQLYGIQFTGCEVMTGLAEYRNGGFFVDFKVLTLKTKPSTPIPSFNVDDDVIIEWRALTIGLLDKVGEMVRQRLGKSEQELPLVKVLEAGTWKAGREIAAKLRPDTKGPPIQINSDGTVF